MTRAHHDSLTHFDSTTSLRLEAALLFLALVLLLDCGSTLTDYLSFVERFVGENFTLERLFHDGISSKHHHRVATIGCHGQDS